MFFYEEKPLGFSWEGETPAMTLEPEYMRCDLPSRADGPLAGVIMQG